MVQTHKIDEIGAEVKSGPEFRRVRPTSGTMRPSNRGRTAGRRMWVKNHFEQMRDASKIGQADLMPTHSSFALVEEAVMLWGFGALEVGVDRVRLK